MPVHLGRSGTGPLELTPTLTDARALGRAGRELEQQGDPEGAVACYDRALALLAGEAQHPIVAELLYFAGVVRTRLGQTTLAESLFHQGLEVATWCDDRRGQARAVNGLASVAQRRGDLQLAESQYRRATRLANEAADFRLVGTIEQNLGVLASIRGDADCAIVHYRRSQTAFLEADYTEGLTWVLNNMGMLMTDLGHFAEGVQHLDEALALARLRQDRILEGLVELNRSEALLGLGRSEEARTAVLRANELAEERGDRLQRAEAFKYLAILDRRAGNLKRAISSLEEGCLLAKEGEDVLLVAELLREMGECRMQAGELELAFDCWRKALQHFDELGATVDCARLRGRMEEVAEVFGTADGERLSR